MPVTPQKPSMQLAAMQKNLIRFLFLVFVITGCAQFSPWVKVRRPWTPDVLENAQQARITPFAEDRIVLDYPRIVRSTNEIVGVPAGSASLEEVAFDLDGLERLETRQSTDVDVGDFFLLELTGVLITFIAALVIVGTAAS